MKMQSGQLTGLLLILVVMVAGPGCSRETGSEYIDHTGHAHAESDQEVERYDADDHTGNDHGEVDLTTAERRLIGLEVDVAEEMMISRSIELPGEIELNADRLAHIVPRVAGVVREVRKCLGDRVEAGEVLAILDSRELADARAEFLSAGETMELTRIRYDREVALRSKGISSEEELLDARQALAEVTIALRSARQKLLALGLTGEELAAEWSGQNTDFTEYPLVAPAAGLVIEKHITLGEALEADAQVYTISDLGTVWGRVEIYQQNLVEVREGQQVRFYTADDELLATGSIDFVTPLLGERTRTASARVTLDNSTGELRPGTFVNAVVEIGQADRAVAVPVAAVQMLEGETILFIPEGDGFEARPVTTGRRLRGVVEITAGLPVGESYVSRGAFELKAKLVTSNLDPHAGHGH